MKQVININFQGRVVPIEVTAFETLKAYTESLSRHFANEEGKEEIINDIENRIGELFQERLKEGATCITDDDVAAVIRSMGRPEDFDTEEPIRTESAQEQQSYERAQEQSRPHRLYRDENEKVFGGVCSGLANYFNIDVIIIRIIFIVLAVSAGFGIISYLILWLAVPTSASTTIGGQRKKLYRDGDDKIIGGVCRGISHYFGINVWIPRVLFLLPFLSFISHWSRYDYDSFKFVFSPGSLIIYIILWLVLPEAVTTAEKLEMKGEKVDLNSIKNSVVEEMKGVQKRADKISKDATAFAQERGKTFATEVNNVAKRGGRTLGDVIILIFKIFAYFILGVIVFALVAALFGFGIAAAGLFPIKDFVLTDGWQNAFAWGTLIFFIITPIIGIITWLIRRLAKIKTRRRMVRLSFFSLWMIGLVSFILLIVSVGRDFRASSSLDEQEVALVNPSVAKLEVTSNDPAHKIYRNRWLKLEPFESFIEDTAFVGNVNIHIIKSPTDSFRVTMMKAARGRNRYTADTLASMINFNVQQIDSVLLLDRAIAVNRKDKFRNQHVIINIYVPVGKQIRIDRSVDRNGYVSIGSATSDNWTLDYEDEEEGWESDVTYVMKADGLFTLDNEPADKWKHRRNSNTRVHIDENGITVDDYRYDPTAPMNKLDSVKMEFEIRKQKMKDSLQKVKDEAEKELNKISEVRIDKTAGRISSISSYNPMVMMF